MPTDLPAAPSRGAPVPPADAEGEVRHDDAMNERDLDFTLRPRAFSPTLTLKIEPAGVTIMRGGRELRLPWQEITRVRLAYAPTNLTHHAFSCTISARGRAVTFGSVSWKSITELVRRDAEYSAFVTRLCAMAAQHNPAIRFEAGLPRWKHTLFAAAGLVVTVALMVATLALASAGAWVAAALTLAFTGSFVWFAIRHARNNTPAAFRPEAPPARVLPRPAG